MSMVPYGAQPQDAHHLLGAVGDISFSAHTVNVPGRSFPMAGTIWNVRDMSVTTTRIRAGPSSARSSSPSSAYSDSSS